MGDYHYSLNANKELSNVKFCKVNSYGRVKNPLRAMSVRKFSDKEPATVQDYGTRKEMKENEQNIQKGLCYIQIAIGITFVTLLGVGVGWPLIYQYRRENKNPISETKNCSSPETDLQKQNCEFENWKDISDATEQKCND